MLIDIFVNQKLPVFGGAMFRHSYAVTCSTAAVHTSGDNLSSKVTNNKAQGAARMLSALYPSPVILYPLRNVLSGDRTEMEAADL